MSPRESDAPVSVKNPPVLVGDIRPGDKIPLTIQGTVDEEALPGTHTILLNLTYRYVYAIPIKVRKFDDPAALPREVTDHSGRDHN